jgi:hypothetical protein
MESSLTSISSERVQELVDRLLLEEGRLDPIEFLVAGGLLMRDDYGTWLQGGRTDLQGLLKSRSDVASDLVERAARYALSQGLVATRAIRATRVPGRTPPGIGADPRLCAACEMVYVPSPDRLQRDLFHESTLTVIEGAIRDALLRGQAEEAMAQLGRLTAHEPSSEHVRGFLKLIALLETPSLEVGPGVGALQARELAEVARIAHERLGADADEFMRGLWAGLAQGLTGQPFEPAAPEAHAAFAWAQAGRWASAREVIEAETRWQIYPALVQLHAEACWSLGDWTAARRDWLGLCCEEPELAESLFETRAFPDPHLAALWDEFGDVDGRLQTEDFPLWLMLRDPHTFGLLDDGALADDARGEVYRLLRRMVSGDDAIECRQRLGELHPSMLELYLSTARS